MIKGASYQFLPLSASSDPILRAPSPQWRENPSVKRGQLYKALYSVDVYTKPFWTNFQIHCLVLAGNNMKASARRMLCCLNVRERGAETPALSTRALPCLLTGKDLLFSNTKSRGTLSDTLARLQSVSLTSVYCSKGFSLRLMSSKFCKTFWKNWAHLLSSVTSEAGVPQILIL